MRSSSAKTLAGSSRRTIWQKMQVASAAGGTVRAKSRGGLNLAPGGSPLGRGPQDPLRDDQLLDLVGAFVQAEDACVAEQPLHVELPAEPVAAVHLAAPVRPALELPPPQ